MKKIEKEVRDDVVIVKLGSRIVGDEHLELRRQIADILAEIPEQETPKIIVDMEKVVMMDASGLGALVSAFTSVQKRKGKLVLLKPGKGIENLIAITKLTRVFDVYDNEAQALQALKEG